MGEGGVTGAVLATLGELACVAGKSLQRSIGEVAPLIIDSLQDSSSGAKRMVAVTCLGQVQPLPRKIWRARRTTCPQRRVALGLPYTSLM